MSIQIILENELEGIIERVQSGEKIHLWFDTDKKHWVYPPVSEEEQVQELLSGNYEQFPQVTEDDINGKNLYGFTKSMKKMYGGAVPGILPDMEYLKKFLK